MPRSLEDPCATTDVNVTGTITVLEAARRAGDLVLLTRAINNGLDLIPSHSDEAAALRAEMREVSARVGFDKLGTAAALAGELEAAYSAADLSLLRRVAAEGSQWWGKQGSQHAWVSNVHVGFALEEGRIEVEEGS